MCAAAARPQGFIQEAVDVNDFFSRAIQAEESEKREMISQIRNRDGSLNELGRKYQSSNPELFGELFPKLISEAGAVRALEGVSFNEKTIMDLQRASEKLPLPDAKVREIQAEIRAIFGKTYRTNDAALFAINDFYHSSVTPLIPIVFKGDPEKGCNDLDLGRLVGSILSDLTMSPEAEAPRVDGMDQRRATPAEAPAAPHTLKRVAPAESEAPAASEAPAESPSNKRPRAEGGQPKERLEKCDEPGTEQRCESVRKIIFERLCSCSASARVEAIQLRGKWEGRFYRNRRGLSNEEKIQAKAEVADFLMRWARGSYEMRPSFIMHHLAEICPKHLPMTHEQISRIERERQECVDDVGLIQAIYK